MLKMWKEEAWDESSSKAALKQPLKGLKTLPKMEGVTKETSRFLKLKSLYWMLTQDHDRQVMRGFLTRPFRYGFNYFRSIFKNRSYIRDGDFFLYGIDAIDQFSKAIDHEDALLVVGFSYCHKPFECPSGRFTSHCVNDLKSLVCQQCFIGKMMTLLPEEKVIPLVIPTVHYIGGKIFEILHQNPAKKVIFMITACELTLKMFGDYGNMAGIEGIGVRLDGRICNTMRAFKLSEKGIKPGLTVVLNDTQERMLNLLRKTWN
ncbi:MAG: hypothetical protein WD595_03150 [Waddliaceae bacterium]